MKHLHPLTLAAILACACTAIAGADARAQGFGGGGGIVSNGFQPPVKGGGVVPKTSLPPPPGLPGAAKHETPAPASKLALDVPPTEALFDAIDRGDLAAARDALSRGADMSGQNVLGMTPIELSIDLGRNDITFLLLSLRGGGTPERVATASAGTAGPSPLKGKAATRTAAQAPQAPRLAATMRAVRPAGAAPVPGLPPASVRYAGSTPGTAVPQAGFLGFGGAGP